MYPYMILQSLIVAVGHNVCTTGAPTVFWPWSCLSGSTGTPSENLEDYEMWVLCSAHSST